MADDDPRMRRRGDRFHGRVHGAAPRCAHPDCDEPGEFRAPGAPHRRGGPSAGLRTGFDGPGAYRWLCLDHVRQFNAGYNFFDGMSVDEIYDAQRSFAGWERETRAFAHAGGSTGPRWSDFTDPLDAISARFRVSPEQARRDGKPLSENDRKALKTLGLNTDADRMALRRRYSELVRRYHPDRNGGDRSHESALQDVIAAYQRLKKAPSFA